ncbi:DMT family transporter [Pseudomonas schmalbachii]|uniref:DMT family transporter n=1 Tax=Pseudomonas schmalbachii TaxID=2816993 RepID=A0ABS3TU78_9PSED|nr:DMT family transporter [Pseudomonas schmalbachii]MBO3277226.1 DMT family transporter [Pseudomonas schmalbachii]
MSRSLLLLTALSVGGMVALQAGSNALLGRQLGHPLSASLTSLGVSLGVVVLALLLFRAPLPAAASVASVPWWGWLGGLFGAAYLTVAVILAPQLGAATFLACVVAGQMLVSALCDQFGWAGFPVRRLSPEGIFALLLIVAGVLLLQWRGRLV